MSGDEGGVMERRSPVHPQSPRINDSWGLELFLSKTIKSHLSPFSPSLRVGGLCTCPSLSV